MRTYRVLKREMEEIQNIQCTHYTKPDIQFVCIEQENRMCPLIITGKNWGKGN